MITLRHPDGTEQRITWLRAAAMLLTELRFEFAWRTAQDLRDAEVFTTYGFRDGRLLYADPQGLRLEGELAEKQRAVRAAGEVA